MSRRSGSHAARAPEAQVNSPPLAATSAPTFTRQPRRLGFGQTLLASFNDPIHALKTALALARGYRCLAFARLRGVRFRAGRNLRIYGSLSVKGPGEIIFGDDVCVIGDATPWTYSPSARIVVGNRVMMGSARFGCVKEITIGDDAILAEVSIADTDFHSTWANRHSDSAPIRVAPVHVGRNAWLGQASALLPGVSIGENSVVSYGAVCMRAFPANVIIIGNPAKVAAPIPSGSGPMRAPDSIADPEFPAVRQPRSSKPGL